MKRLSLSMSARWLAAGLAALAALPAAASAHQGDPNYRSELDGVVPDIPGLNVQVLNYDDSLQLQNETGDTVVVEGYENEPYLRFERNGTVQVNTASPAYYLNDDRLGEVAVPDSANAKAPPQWQTVEQTGQYTWHDHRIHWMAEGTPPEVTDPDVRTKVLDYRVPIEVGARKAAITGTLYWVGEPGGFPLAPFIGLGLAALLAVAAIVFVRRRRAADAEEPAKEAKEAW